MCDHSPNREAAMVRIQGTPVPGVTTKVGYCDPCLHPLIQALNDGGQTTFASCCGHGHRPGWIALTDDRWLVVATEEQRHVIDDAFPVDINGQVETPDEPSACTDCNGTGVVSRLPIGGLEQRALCPRCHDIPLPDISARVRELHQRDDDGWCEACETAWPCPTIALLADQPPATASEEGSR